MASPYIQNYQELTAYIYRRLGSPVVNVEIDPTQIPDIIDEAMSIFLSVAYSGTQMKIKTIPVNTTTNVYIMDYTVSSILWIFNPQSVDMLGDLAGPNSVFQVSDYLAQNFQKNGYFSGGNGMILTYTAFQIFAATMDMHFGIEVGYSYNSATKELFIYNLPQDVTQLTIIYYDSVDPTNPEYPNYQYIYDDVIFKRLVVAIAKIQWGTNLIKYSGSPLPAGMTLNGEKILEEGNKQKELLMDELYSRYVLPTDFFVG